MSERNVGEIVDIEKASISGAENRVSDGERERGTKDLGGTNAWDFMAPLSVMETITEFSE